MLTLRRPVALLALYALSELVAAQGLPPASRTVFRCEVNGRVHYSDAPCLGAKKIEVEPTRGLDRSAGARKVGPDVQRERRHEEFAQAFQPVTGMNAKQLDLASRRMKLSPEAQRACRQLDLDIARLEAAEPLAAPEQVPGLQGDLYARRSSFRQLRC